MIIYVWLDFDVLMWAFETNEFSIMSLSVTSSNRKEVKKYDEQQMYEQQFPFQVYFLVVDDTFPINISDFAYIRIWFTYLAMLGWFIPRQIKNGVYTL